MNHETFLEYYNKKEITVRINKDKAGDFILSQFADPKYKSAHLFWSWLGIAFIVPIPIFIWIKYNWFVAVICLIIGILVLSNVRRSAAEFVLKNMLDDKIFFNYAILHKGAELFSKDETRII